MTSPGQGWPAPVSSGNGQAWGASVTDRRDEIDRRAGGQESGSPTDRRATSERRGGLDRRRGPGRRRSDIRRQAEEGEITGDLLEFVMAMDEYKRQNNRPFPTWSEVFELIHYLGYRKVADRADHINRISTDQTTAVGSAATDD